MVTSLKIEIDREVYNFERVVNGREISFNVFLIFRQEPLHLGEVIRGRGFRPKEGTVIRTTLMEALKEFYEMDFKITKG